MKKAILGILALIVGGTSAQAQEQFFLLGCDFNFASAKIVRPGKGLFSDQSVANGGTGHGTLIIGSNVLTAKTKGTARFVNFEVNDSSTCGSSETDTEDATAFAETSLGDAHYWNQETNSPITGSATMSGGDWNSKSVETYTYKAPGSL